MKQKYIIMTIVAATIAAAAIVTAWRTGGPEERPDGETLLAKGIEELNSNNVAQAFGLLQQAAETLTERNDSDRLFEAVVYTALLYGQIGQHDSAYAMLKRVEYRDVPNYKDYASQYYLRMMGYYKLSIDRDYAAAETFTRHAIEFSREKYPGDAAYMFVDMANLAEIHITTGQPEKACPILDSLERIDKTECTLYMSEVYYCRGLMALQAGQRDTAVGYLTACVDVSHEYNSFDNELNSLRLLSEIDSANNDLPRYIAHRRAYNNLRESIKGNEVRHRIDMMREQHKVNLLRQESAKRSMVFKLTLCIMCSVIVAMLTVIAYIYKSAKTRHKLARIEKQRLDDAVERERLENELLQLKLRQQGKKLDNAHKENIAMGMKLAEQGHDVDMVGPLERVLREMDNDFMHKVKTMYPRISHNDIRLMCMIRMGLSSGEIAKILNITMDSLHKSRYRLRKKIGLEGGQSLEAFVNSL